MILDDNDCLGVWALIQNKRKERKCKEKAQPGFKHIV